MVRGRYTEVKEEKSLGKTTIKVSRETLKTLRSLKKHPRETMESVILRLIAKYRGDAEPPVIIH